MVQNGVEQDPVDEVEYLSDRLNEGVCGVSIASSQPNHYGLWTCTLIATEGQVLTGAVDVRGENP